MQQGLPAQWPTCLPTFLPGHSLPTERARIPWLSGRSRSLLLWVVPPELHPSDPKPKPSPANANPIAPPTCLGSGLAPKRLSAAVPIVGNPHFCPRALTTSSCSQIVLPISCYRGCIEGASWPHPPTPLSHPHPRSLSSSSSSSPSPSVLLDCCCYYSCLLLSSTSIRLLAAALDLDNQATTRFLRLCFSFFLSSYPTLPSRPANLALLSLYKDIPPRLFFD